MYIHVFKKYVYTNMYIYIYVCVCIYIYIYMSEDSDSYPKVPLNLLLIEPVYLEDL